VAPAAIVVLQPTGTPVGTVVHFSGGGGTGLETGGVGQYKEAGLLQVFVAWSSDWEQTASLGIKAAGCVPRH
jgi:hypothetical protein